MMQRRLALLIAMIAAVTGADIARSQQQNSQNTVVRTGADGFLTVSGSGDFGNLTHIHVHIRKPYLPDAKARMARGLPACGEDCVPATGPDGMVGIAVPVKGGTFVAGPFSFSGKPIPPGPYVLEIFPSFDLKTATQEQIEASGTVIFSSAITVVSAESGTQSDQPKAAKKQQAKQEAKAATAVPGNYVPNWRRLEADNGAEYQVDLNSIHRNTDGSADVVVYNTQGPNFDPRNMRRWYFTCRGYFRVSTNAGLSQPIYVPPKSVAAQVGDLACGGAQGQR